MATFWVSRSGPPPTAPPMQVTKRQPCRHQLRRRSGQRLCRPTARRFSSCSANTRTARSSLRCGGYCGCCHHKQHPHRRLTATIWMLRFNSAPQTLKKRYDEFLKTFVEQHESLNSAQSQVTLGTRNAAWCQDTKHDPLIPGPYFVVAREPLFTAHAHHCYTPVEDAAEISRMAATRICSA